MMQDILLEIQECVHSEEHSGEKIDELMDKPAPPFESTE
jgi:hypothetical protein